MRWGAGRTAAELFNLSQAKAYMQTLLVGSGAKRLIEQGETTTSPRFVLHAQASIDGTEETFDEQNEKSDTVIEDVEVVLEALREELHLYAQKRGDMVGRSRSSIAATKWIAPKWGAAATAFLRSSSQSWIQKLQGKVCAARRKRHGLAATQRRQVLAQT